MYLMKVLGWSVSSVLTKFNFESRSKTYTVNEGKQMNRASSLLMMWLNMIEQASDEYMPVFCRMSAVKSMDMAGVLLWSIQYGVSSLQAHSGPFTEMKVNSLVSGPIHNGELASRLWLVVLKLMQDDDIDVRCAMGNCLTASTHDLDSVMRTAKVIHLLDHEGCCDIFRLRNTLIENCFDSGRTAECVDDISVTPDEKSTNRTNSSMNSLQFPKGFQTVHNFLVELMVKPLAMCVMWSLLCDAVPRPQIESGWSPTANSDGDAQIPLTHRGFRFFLNTFTELSGGDAQRLNSLVRNAGLNRYTEMQQIFEVDSPNLHSESIVSAHVLSSAFGVVVRALPIAETTGLIKFLISRAESAISVLKLTLHKLAWVGGSSYHPDIFNFAYCSLSAVKMIVLVVKKPIVTEEIDQLLSKLKLSAFILVEKSKQVITRGGKAISRPSRAKNIKNEATCGDESESWYNSLPLSYLLPFRELNVEQEDIKNSSRSMSIVSSDCDTTIHSETAQLRVPLQETANNSDDKVFTLHPILVSLLHDIILC